MVRRAGSGGPGLLVVGGIHGDELNGIEAARRIEKELKPERGALSVIAVANPSAYSSCLRENPDDWLDLNRCFPGDDSTRSGRLAASIFREVKKADYAIDLHTGSRRRVFLPHVRLRISNEKQKKIAAFAGLPILSEGYIANTFQTESVRVGVPAVTMEAGEAGFLSDAYVEALFEAVKRVMSGLGMIDGPVPDEKPVHVTRARVKAPAGGVVNPLAELGSHVNEGDVVAFMDGYGIRAPVSGWVLGLWKDSHIKKDETIISMVKDTTNHELARTHLKAARYAEAIKCYKELIERDPSDEDAWLSMGGAYRALGEYEKAIECYDRAIQINPENDDHWYYRGKAFSRLSLHKEALQCFDMVLKLNPRDEFAWISRAKSLTGLNSLEDALQSLDKAVDINNRNEDSLYLRALILKSLGRKKEADRALHDLLAINPHHHAGEGV